MKIINYKSLGSVIWRVLKNPLANELSHDEAAEYALEFARKYLGYVEMSEQERNTIMKAS